MQYNVNSILPHEEGWHARIDWGSTAYVDLPNHMLSGSHLGVDVLVQEQPKLSVLLSESLRLGEERRTAVKDLTTGGEIGRLIYGTLSTYLV